MGRAFSEVISAQLAQAPNVDAIGMSRIRALSLPMGLRPASAPGASTEQAAALAAGANRIGYGTYWLSGGRLQARLEIQDPARMRDVRVFSASAPASNVVGAASELSHQISARAGRYGTSNEAALMNYAGAIEAPDASTAESKASLAIAADPDFGPPYRLLAEIKAQRDRDAALALLEGALARPAIHPLEHARLQLEAARLRRDPAALENSLATLAKLEPLDAGNWKALAEAATARHNYRQALSAWQAVLKLQPDNVEALNASAYAAAYAGDLSAGVAALRRYAALRPKDPNALDSLGDVHLIVGKLKEAEEFYIQAVKKDPNFYSGADWFKAAMAHLMTGDVSGADGLAAQYISARSAAHDPTVPMLEAEWQWLSGRRKPAYRALEQFARSLENGQSHELAARAYTQLAIWSLILDDRPAAAQMSAKAVALAGPATANDAVIARFLAQPPTTAEEWQSRAARLAPSEAQQTIRDTVLAHALLASREFAPASDILRRLYDSGAASNNEGLPVLLAWTYLETGRDNDAAPLLQFNPIPPIAGPAYFTGLYFPRIFDLRARLGEKQGKADEAQANRKIFAALSEPRP